MNLKKHVFIAESNSVITREPKNRYKKVDNYLEIKEHWF